MAFRFAQMTDSHLYAMTHAADRDRRDAVFMQMARQCAEHEVDLIVHTGDLCNGSSGEDDHRRFRDLYQRIEAELGIPYHVVRGNHDASISDGAYHAIHGKGTYLFHHKGWAFLAIDRYFRYYEHTHHAMAMSAETIDHVRELLAGAARDQPMVVLLHDDPVGVSRFHRGLELMHLLEPFNVQLLLFGHVQANYLGRYRGIPFVTCTGDDRPHDCSALTYNIVTCGDDGRARCDFYPYTLHTPPRPQPTGLAPMNSAPTLGGDWPSLRGPAGTRLAEGSLPEQAPRLAWSAKLDGGLGVSSLTLAGGRVFASTMGHGRFADCAAHALDAATGKPRWRAPLDGCAEGGLLVEDGRGYVGTSAGSVYCLDTQTGETIWRWNNRDNMPVACQPIRHDGLLHLGANWEMYALRASDGDTAWRAIATDDGLTYMGPGNATPLAVGGRIFHRRPFNGTEFGQSQVQSVLAATGKKLAKVGRAPNLHPKYRHASPIVYDGKIFAVADGLICIDPAQPDTFAWWADGPIGSATPAAADGVVYVSYHTHVVAHDLSREGAELWRTPHEPSMYHFGGAYDSKWGVGIEPLGAYAAPLVCGDKLIVCDTGGRVRCLRRSDGAEAWRVQFEGPLLTAPIISGQTLFVGDYHGRLTALAW